MEGVIHAQDANISLTSKKQKRKRNTCQECQTDRLTFDESSDAEASDADAQTSVVPDSTAPSTSHVLAECSFDATDLSFCAATKIRCSCHISNPNLHPQIVILSIMWWPE